MCVCAPGVTTAAAAAAASQRDVGWGRVCVFLHRLGKKADSRSLSLAHCDLTATDLLELGEHAAASRRRLTPQPHAADSRRSHAGYHQTTSELFDAPNLKAADVTSLYTLNKMMQTIE